MLRIPSDINSLYRRSYLLKTAVAANNAVANGSKLEKEYEKAYTAWRANPNQETTSELLVAIDPIITRHVNSLPGANKNILKNQAKLIIVKSIGRYDPTNTNLNTFLSQQLMGLRRSARKGNPMNILHTPEHQALAYNKIRDAKIELSNTLDRMPSDDEIADYLHMPVEHVRKYQRKSTGVAESLATAPMEGADGGSSKQNPEVRTPMSVKARRDYVYGELNDQDKVIFTHIPEFSADYGNDPMTPDEMAQQLNRSVSFISDRKKHIQEKMEEADSLF